MRIFFNFHFSTPEIAQSCAGTRLAHYYYFFLSNCLKIYTFFGLNVFFVAITRWVAIPCSLFLPEVSASKSITVTVTVAESWESISVNTPGLGLGLGLTLPDTVSQDGKGSDTSTSLGKVVSSSQAIAVSEPWLGLGLSLTL